MRELSDNPQDEGADNRRADLEGETPEELRSPSTGLLSFYDRLRERVASWIAAHAGRRGETVADLLLAAPDLFMMLARLSIDPEVPRARRALVGGAVAYFLLPADLVPELFLGVGGYVDDVVLAAAVLGQAFGEDLEPWAERHWSGSRRLRRVIADAARVGHAVLGQGLLARIDRFVDRYGPDERG